MGENLYKNTAKNHTFVKFLTLCHVDSYTDDFMMDNTNVHENEGDVEFLCPHGPPECKGMLVHACAINTVPQDLVLQYVFCMIMDNWNGLVIGEKCAKKLEIDWHSVLGCVNSNKSTMYLLHYKELTMSLNPPLTQVPRVVINGNNAHGPTTISDYIAQVMPTVNEFLSEHKYMQTIGGWLSLNHHIMHAKDLVWFNLVISNNISYRGRNLR
ncbi:gamma-interferon-inducible-lysosomal thiol reductase-like [Schistocerca serialis cubense]|uniref:gamma-interferon-inducible-lysosomal thiol reductase-like n=1 Tax=Schistocerca serialis cubense TaxID=2023355 RepID=UPI00214E1D84|nr:gamma-interferon-inducible-lysosomal thiol reductase-like [Schistocerca serialis cubense]